MRRPAADRAAHLARLRTPTLILQGERDPFGRREEVAERPLSPRVRLHWLADGDHGLRPRKSSGRSAAEAWAEAVGICAAFLAELSAGDARAG